MASDTRSYAKGASSVPIYRPPKKSKPKPPATRRPSTGGGGSKGKSSGGGGGGGGGISGAERRAVARENKALRKARDRNVNEARVLEHQVSALKKALKNFGVARDTRLGNILRVSTEQDGQLLEAYLSRVEDLKGNAKDNETAAAGQTFAALSNRGRERTNALSEAMNVGAGESDVLRASMMSLRSWNANQAEVNRSYFDSLRSINGTLGDLNQDTKTGRLNIESQANADRDQVWTQYYNQQSETNTQLGNIRGQQAALYGQANEAVSSKKLQNQRKKYSAGSKSFFAASAAAAGKAYENPGNSAALKNWEGEADIKGSMNNAILGEATGEVESSAAERKRPEGASLRKW